MAFGSGWRRLAVIRVEQDLPLQQDAGDPEQSIGDTAQGAAVGMATRAQGLVAVAACWIMHDGYAGPVEHGLAKPDRCMSNQLPR